MANISAEDEGLYQQSITGGQVLNITVEPRTTITPDGMQIIVHDGEEPVYVKRGVGLKPRDPESQMVVQGSFLQLEVPIGHEYTISIVSEADAVVSVSRS